MASDCVSPPQAASRRAPLSDSTLHTLRRTVAMRKRESFRAIAAKVGVSEATVRRRAAANDWTPKRLGRAPLLDQSSEARFIGLLMQRWSEGRGMTQKTMRLEAAKFMTPTRADADNDGDEAPSHGWSCRFMKRNASDLRLLSPQPYPSSRAAGNSRDVYTRFFGHLRAAYNTLSLTEYQVWNVDEVIFGDKMKLCHVVGPAGGTGTKTRALSQATIRLIICGSASGSMMPPTVVAHAKESISPEVANAVEKAGFYFLAVNGADQTGDDFASWVRKVFLENLPRRRPQLLVMDNSSIHMTEVSLKTLAEAGTHVVTLPPSTTDRTQPLDVAVFRPVKAHWLQRANERMQRAARPEYSVAQLIKWLHEAFGAADVHTHLIKGFEATGLWPLNPKKLVPPLEMTHTEATPAAEHDGGSSPGPVPARAGEITPPPPGTPVAGRRRQRVWNQKLPPPASRIRITPGQAMSPAELRELVSVREEQRQMVLEDRLAREIERTAFLEGQERRAASGPKPQVIDQQGDAAGQPAAPQGQRGRRKLRVRRDDTQRPIRHTRSPLAQLSANTGAPQSETTARHARSPRGGTVVVPPPERRSRATLGYTIFDDSADQATPALRPRLREGLRNSIHPNRSPDFAYIGSGR